ncbi:MAG: penicillin-binding protein 2 [Planctomycetota bacterium]|nr:penicillin-binding protein 2 [Planctomycetota bacterium]
MIASSRIRGLSRGVLIVTIVALGATLVRTAQLKTLPPSKLIPAMGSRTSTSTELAARGRLLDRRGRILATSVVGYRLFADPATIWKRGNDKIRLGLKSDPQASFSTDPFTDAAESLSTILRRPVADIEGILRMRADDRYVVIDGDLSELELDGVKGLDIEGIGIESKLVREYPQGSVAAPIVGKVGFEQKGLSGAELSFDSKLSAKNGKLTFLRDVQRNVLHIEDGQFVPADDGADVRLSIDVVLQDIAERRLSEAVREYNAGGGRLVAFDPQTGDVLAMVDILRSRTGWKEITTDPSRRIDPALGRNRCLTDPFEPGSTFKPFVWETATELGIFSINTKVPTPSAGPHRTSFGRAIRDIKYYGPVSWRTVLVKSLNSGMTIAGERMSFEDMQNKVVNRFGFGCLTNLGVPGETTGLVTPPSAWSKYTQTSVAMGHEIGVTPVQMVRAFSSFCNDGWMPQPRIALPIGSDGRVLATVQTQVMPANLARETRSAMEGVLTEGTGRKAQSALYRMFGKSGTAQLPKPAGQGKGYFEDRYVANFIAGAPYENPRIVVLCVIDDPDKKKGHFGGSIAGPVVRDVIDESLQYLGVKPDQIPSRRATILSLGQDLPVDAKDRVEAALIFTDATGDEDLAAEYSPDAPGMSATTTSLPAHPKSRSSSRTQTPASLPKSNATKATGSKSAASQSTSR